MSTIQPFSATNIHEALVYRNMYTVQGENDAIVYTSKPEAAALLHTAKRLIERSESTENPQEKSTLIGCAYEYLKRIRQEVTSKAGSDEYNSLLSQALLLVMGKPRTQENIASLSQEISTNSEWYTFFTNNHVHYMIHRQGIAYLPGQDSDIAAKINIQGNWHKWSDLEKRATADGFSFYLRDQLVFSTDAKLQLKGYFWAGERGIIQGNSIDHPGIGDFFQRPASGKHWVSVYSVAKSDTDVRFGTSHSYMSIENSDGRLSYIGQYGLTREVTLMDAVTPFGKKAIGIETPDRYSAVPIGQHLLKEVRIEITAEQYKTLKKSVKNDKANNPEGSLVKGNCASFVQQKLDLIGVKAKVSMTATEFFCRLALQPLPRALNKKIVQLVEKLPPIVQKIAYFCPLIYLPMVAILVASRLLSGWKSDISLVNAFFRPWMVKVDHPLALFENMEKLQKEAGKFRIFTSKVTDNSLIGTKIQDMYKNLGFTENEQANLKVKTPRHVTQYTAESLGSMAAKAVFKGVENRIDNLMSKNAVIDQNTMILYLNGLKTQKLITPYEFHALKRSIDDQPALIQKLRAIGQKMYQNQSIDRRSFIHFKDLLEQTNTNDALCYLFSVQLFIQLNTDRYKDILTDLISVDMQAEIQAGLEHYHKNYTFSPDHIIKIESLVSRVKCYEWAESIKDAEIREELKKSIKTKNEQDFIDTAQRHFELLAKDKSSTVTEKKILEELSACLQSHLAQNAFVGFAHVMQTQQMIVEMQGDLEGLAKTVEGYKGRFTDSQVAELKAMHQNMGVFLANEVEFTGSATWISVRLGEARNIWQRIDDMLIAHNANMRVIPLAGEKDSWPDIGFREIKTIPPAGAVGEDARIEMPKKKVFIIYQSRGNGHKATAEAYAHCLEDTYRVSTCDLPDEVLIQKDPLFQLLGKHNSITTLYNTLVAGNYWNVLGLLRKMGSGATPEAEVELQKDMIRRKYLQEKPDLIICTFGIDAKKSMEVAQELGIPFLLVSTDMVSEYEDIDQRVNGYDHLKVAIPFGIPEAKDALKDRFKDDQVAVAGYLIRPQFYEKLDKAQVKAKYNIQPGEKVVLCMNGGCGGDVPWPKMFANAQKGILGKCKMYVVCGKNEAFFKEVQSYKPKDPDIEIIPLGWTDATKLNELNTIADVALTKPGGSTTAETLWKKAYMLLDTRFSKALPWELDTANPLEKYEQGIKISRERDFFDMLKTAFANAEKNRPEFPGQVENPHKEVRSLVAGMLVKAESDPQQALKRSSAFAPKNSYGKMELEECSSDTFNQNLAELLKFNEGLFPKEVVPSLYRSLWKASRDKSFIRFNPQRNVFETSPEFNKDQIVYAMLLLKKLSHEEAGLPLEAFEHISEIVLRHSRQSKDDLEAVFKGLADLDREHLAMRIASGKVVPPKTLEEAQGLYLFEGSRKQLADWVNLKTSKGRFKNRDESVFRNKDEALKAFVAHPEEYDFIQKLYLHRKVSAFNHQFEVSDGHIAIMLEGKMTPVATFMKRFNYVNDRIINIHDDREYTYTYDKGLCPVDETNNPCDWKDSIPVFKKKNRKTEDYRLEVFTTIGTKQNHGWIRLKDPEGNVHSLGRMWDRDYQLAAFNKMLKTIPGYIRSGDIQEFLGEEANWKQTKFVVSKEDFQKVKDKIFDIQKNEKSYNLVNKNCLSFVQDVMRTIGIQHKVGESALYLYTLPLGLRKFMIRHQTIGKICKTVIYPFTVLKNALFAAFGMFERRDTMRYEQGGFNEALDLLKTSKSLIDHHTQLRLIQEIMEEDLGDPKRGKKIFWSDLQNP